MAEWQQQHQESLPFPEHLLCAQNCSTCTQWMTAIHTVNTVIVEGLLLFPFTDEREHRGKERLSNQPRMQIQGVHLAECRLLATILCHLNSTKIPSGSPPVSQGRASPFLVALSHLQTPPWPSAAQTPPGITKC